MNHTQWVRSNLLLAESAQYEIARKRFLEQYDYYYRTGETDRIWAAWEESMRGIQDAYLCAGGRQLLKWLWRQVHDDTAWYRSHVHHLKRAALSVQTEPRRSIRYRDQIFYADMEGVLGMNKDERNSFCTMLRDLAVGAGTQELSLIKNAFGAAPSKPLLTKEEAFRLAHLLSFSLHDVEEFLFRVFQDGEGGNGKDVEDESNLFNFKRSRDVIEYFCFSFADENHDPKKLTDAYEAQCGAIEKAPPEPGTIANVTQEIAGDMTDEQKKPDWKSEGLTAGEREARFLAWLKACAPYLDVPSQSATALARLLARKILAFLKRKVLPFDLAFSGNDPLSDCTLPLQLPQLTNIIMTEYTDRVLEKESWQDSHWSALAVDIRKLLHAIENNRTIFENDGLAEAEKRGIQSTALYTFLTPRRDKGDGVIGEWTKLQGGDRLTQILLGKTAPCKNDILILIFTIANCCWMRNNAPRREVMAQASQFEAVCSELLNGSRFPTIGRFYHCHYTEFCMLSAIIFSGTTDNSMFPIQWYLQLTTSHDKKAGQKPPRSGENG